MKMDKFYEEVTVSFHGMVWALNWNENITFCRGGVWSFLFNHYFGKDNTKCSIDMIWDDGDRLITLNQRRLLWALDAFIRSNRKKKDDISIQEIARAIFLQRRFIKVWYLLKELDTKKDM